MLGQPLIGPLLANFLNEYPDVRLVSVLSDHVVHLLRSGFDLALAVGPLANSDLVAVKLGAARSRWLPLAPPGPLASFGDRRAVERPLAVVGARDRRPIESPLHDRCPQRALMNGLPSEPGLRFLVDREVTQIAVGRFRPS